MIQSVHDPYEGLEVSDVTSNVIPLRHALDFSLSAWTSAGTTSTLTLQVSDSGATAGAVAAASWSAFTAAAPSAATVVRPFDDLRGVPRWARLIRNPSIASFELRYQLREK